MHSPISGTTAGAEAAASPVRAMKASVADSISRRGSRTRPACSMRSTSRIGRIHCAANTRLESSAEPVARYTSAASIR